MLQTAFNDIRQKMADAFKHSENYSSTVITWSGLVSIQSNADTPFDENKLPS